ncbi:DUF4153 domain-containing protein [Flavobacterium cellulosilyticum]|uniref:DUF4173 domain-containing protein n=1 Tax=Flavobacterium cellulosilyticum TaxID=2541731 RepID=A0A4R5CAM9_9FLAO|nr:DUF4173 domain-containing protein [Flavobacterium cellulosilyticum]TDD96991.1 DUF4173 domain-containing protein [Flavobacterium cellulosilyticum]
MKKHQLILVCTALFSFLFYKESIGLNLALFGIVVAILVFIQFKTKSALIKFLFVNALFSCLAFAWYGDFVSFLALFISLIFLQFQNEFNKLKIIQSIPIVIITGITSLGRPFIFNQWLPQTKINNNGVKKLIAFVLIPALFIICFFIAYSFGSETFSGLLQYEFDIDFGSLILVVALGFYFSFSYWNYWVPDYLYANSYQLNNNFSTESVQDVTTSFSFLDIDFERKSGEISLILLNLMLLVFIGAYNYEQFFKTQPISELSSATHDRVNSVIISIIMAVGVILFYFKKGFNFDAKALFLKLLAKIWVSLNAVLVVSSAIKNSEYIIHFGLTYKRLGVYAFLMITLIGLLFTFYKIKYQKTNAFLFNKMIWVLYGVILVCSFINWGTIITNYNISVNKGVEPKFLSSLNYNNEARRTYFSLYKLNGENSETDREDNIEAYKKRNFLSKIGYYEFLNKN